MSWNDGNYVWLNRLDHPNVFGCAAAAAFGIGLRRLVSTRWLRILVAAGSVIVGGWWFLTGAAWAMATSTSLIPVATTDAPGDRKYKAVVHQGRGWFGETLYYVSIRQTRGLLSRQWPASCITNDGTDGASLHQVRWQSPTRLGVTVGWEGYGITIPVNPRTGKPKPPAR